MLKKHPIEKNDTESEDELQEEEEEVELEEAEEGIEDENGDQSGDSADEDMEQDEPTAGPSKVRTASEGSETEKPAKKKKRGIIYVSSIPKHMNVTIMREMLSQYAKLGRVFLQPGKLPGNYCIIFVQKWSSSSTIPLKHPSYSQISDDGKDRKKKKRRRQARHFTEGWVEFESKRAAKQVAVKLNNSPIASRKSSKFYDILWSMKYLPRFKWVHLSERLTYERAVYRQKLQTEISQARKEAAFFQDNLDKSERNKKMKKKGNKANKVKKAVEWKWE